MNVAPNFHFNGVCKDALELYRKAFNGELTTLILYRDADPADISVQDLTEEEKNYVYHAEMIIGTQRFMFSDATDEIPRGQNVSIVIIFEDPKEVEKTYYFLF